MRLIARVKRVVDEEDARMEMTPENGTKTRLTLTRVSNANPQNAFSYHSPLQR